MPIANINQLRDQVLDKPETKLSSTEVGLLNAVDKKTYDNMKNDIAKEKFELTGSDGKKHSGIVLEDIVKNFNTFNNSFTLNNIKYQVGKGTELWAWIQLYLITNWKNIYNDELGDPSISLGIDWVIWEHSKPAIDGINWKWINTWTFEEVEIGEIAKHNFYAEFVSLYPNLGKTYMDTYKVFKAPNGRFTNCTYNNGDAVITYKSQFSTALQSIKISKIQKPNMNIDNLKLLKGVKDEVEKNEAKLEKINMQNTIQTWVNNLKLKSFTDYLIQRYLEANNKISAQGNIVLNGKTSGMTVTWDNLLVDYWSVIGKKTYKLIDFWKNNKFDDKRMAATLTVTMKNSAIEWKKWQLTTTYKSLEAKTNTGKNISVKTLKDTEDILKWFQDLKKNLDFYKEVKLDANMVNTVKVRIEQLTNQKNYLIAKKWIVADLEKFEKLYNTTMTPKQYDEFKKDINGRVSSLEKWVYKLLPSWVNVTKAFELANRKKELNIYYNRYKAMQR